MAAGVAVQAAELKSVDVRQSGSGVQLFGRTLFNRSDYNPDLHGQAGILKYDRMRTDPEIAGSLLRWKAPLLSANWTFEAPKTGSKAQEMKELCDRYILGVGREDVRDTWKGGLLPQILFMLDYGVSAVEKVWGINEKGQQVYARLCPIGSRTIQEFQLGDLGEITRLVQYAYVMDGGGSSSYRRQLIPDPKKGDISAEEKLAVFTYRQEGDDPFGKPVLRDVYQAWYHKYQLWLLDGMQKERHGLGFMTIKVPNVVTDTNSAEYQAALQFVMESRANERQGGVIGEDWELTIDYPKGTAPDIQGSLNYCDAQITRAMVTEFSSLGNTPSGSRSLSESKIDHFLMCEQALADMIEHQVNVQLVPILCRKNFGNQSEWPSLQCEDLDKMSGTESSQIAKNLSDAKFLRYDRKLEEHYRENLDLPAIDDATREEPAPPPVPFAPAANELQPGADPGKGQAGASDAQKPGETGGAGTAAKKPLAGVARPTFMGAEVSAIGSPVTLSRDPLPHEMYCAFSEMKTYMRDEPQRIWHRVVEPWRRKLALRIASKVPGMADDKLAARDLGAMPGLRSPFEDDLSAALLKVYAEGRSSVLQERQRQLAHAPASTSSVTFQEGDAGNAFDPTPTPAQRDWISTLAVAFVGKLILGMVDEASRQGLASRQADASPKVQESQALAAVEGLSLARQQLELSGAVARTFGTGRSEQADAMRGEIVTEFYTAIMDSATCDVCAAMDGTEQSGGDTAWETPNPNCLGDDNCRCATVYVFREQQAAA